MSERKRTKANAASAPRMGAVSSSMSSRQNVPLVDYHPHVQELVDKNLVHADVVENLILPYADFKSEFKQNDVVEIRDFAIEFLSPLFKKLKLDLRKKFQSHRLTVDITEKMTKDSLNWTFNISYDVPASSLVKTNQKRTVTGIRQALTFSIDTYNVNVLEMFYLLKGSTFDLNGNYMNGSVYPDDVNLKIKDLIKSVNYEPNIELHSDRSPLQAAYETDGLDGVKLMLQNVVVVIRKVTMLIAKSIHRLDPQFEIHELLSHSE